MTSKELEHGQVLPSGQGIPERVGQSTYSPLMQRVRSDTRQAIFVDANLRLCDSSLHLMSRVAAKLGLDAALVMETTQSGKTVRETAKDAATFRPKLPIDWLACDIITAYSGRVVSQNLERGNIMATSKLPTYTVHGRKVRAHNAMCADSFREDRKAGAIYPSVLPNSDGVPATGEGLLTWEQGSVDFDYCVYCGSKE